MSDARDLILKCFDHPTFEWSGRQIMDMTELAPGTVYSLLVILEEQKVLTSRFEDGPSPRRRLYRKV